MDGFDVIIAILATAGLTETIRHGSIFEEWRLKHETANTRLKPIIQCGFCFSHWAALGAVVLVLPHMLFGNRYAVWPTYAIALWFAVRYAANLLNDMTYRFHRTQGARPPQPQKNKE